MPAGDGVYHASDVEPGKVNIRIKADGYARWVREDVELKADEKIEITAELAKRKNFNGKIVTADKEKFRQISIEFPQHCKDDHSMIAKDDSFSFKDLAAGIYKFKAINKKFKSFCFWMKIDSDIKDFEVKSLIEEEKDCSVSLSISEKDTGNVRETEQ